MMPLLLEGIFIKICKIYFS